MKIIARKLAKSDKYDQLYCLRRDGSETSTRMPRQGVLPHDLIHYVVESALRYDQGFLGIVAKGSDISFAMEQAHDATDTNLANQAIYAEALVESLQAQLWSGAFDEEQFQEGLGSACASRSKPAPDLSHVNVRRDLYERVIELGERWHQVPYHGTLELEMEHL
jgi:hypothetical protein